MIHSTAIVESSIIGAGSHVWAYAHIMPGARIGRNVNIGDHCFVEGGATIGDNVTLKNGVCVWEGVTIEDDAFIGPHVTFTNDRYPRSPRMAGVRSRYLKKETWLSTTHVGRGCSIGANATILPAVKLGCYCMTGAGAVVVADVRPFSLVAGNPAVHIAFVCVCGQKLSGGPDAGDCCHCGQTAAARIAILAEDRRPIASERPQHQLYETQEGR